MEKPLVSFCLPTYGRAHFIGETLNSALAQTMEDFEIVVVNDRSPDNTDEVVKNFDDKRIKYFLNETNLGVPQNLNMAMSLAKGAYRVLLEDHDLLEPTYLEETLRLMERYPSVGFVATGLITIDEQGNPKERFVEDLTEFMPGRKLLRRLLTRTDCPFSVTTLIRWSAAEGVSPLFDQRYWWYADQYLWLRLSAKSDFGYVSKTLLSFREREEGHYLEDRVWDSILCRDRIVRENRHLLHPVSSWHSHWDQILYEQSKLQDIAAIRLGKALRNEQWATTDREFSRQILSRTSGFLLDAVGLLPTSLTRQARNIYRNYYKNRTKLSG